MSDTNEARQAHTYTPTEWKTARTRVANNRTRGRRVRDASTHPIERTTGETNPNEIPGQTSLFDISPIPERTP